MTAYKLEKYDNVCNTQIKANSADTRKNEDTMGVLGKLESWCPTLDAFKTHMESQGK
jgi:hypothetical protein